MELLDKKKYGEVLRWQRIRADYRSASAFSQALFDETGLYVCKNVILRIESGHQGPSLEQHIAFTKLFHKVFFDEENLNPLDWFV